MRRKAIAALLLALALLLTACAGGDITSEQVHLFYAARTETARGGRRDHEHQGAHPRLGGHDDKRTRRAGT